MINIGKIKSTINDELYTPEYAIKPILKYIKLNSNILCIFDTENSNFVKVLKKDHFVYNSHIWNKKDFFDYTKDDVKLFDYIISNPLFSIKDKVLNKLYELEKPFIMLLPISTLEGVYRN